MAFDRFDKIGLSEFIATESSPGALWIFLHIPRTAGSSFTTEFAELRPGHKHLRVDATEEQIPNAKKMTRAVEQFARELETRSYKACSGHIKIMHVKRIQAVEPSARAITIVRNPVDRVISDFRHARTPAHPPHAEFIRKYPRIEDYVEAPESQDKMARFMGHHAIAELSDLLDTVDKTFTFVGLTEMYPMSFNIISRLFGQNRFPKVHKRAAVSTGENDVTVDAALRRQIVRNNEADFQLYEHVKAKLVARRSEWQEMLSSEKRGSAEIARTSLQPDSTKPHQVRGRKTDKSAQTWETAGAAADSPKQTVGEQGESDVAKLEKARIAGLIHRVRSLEQERLRMRAENLRLSRISKQFFQGAPPASGDRSLHARVRARRAIFMNLLAAAGEAAHDLAAYAQTVDFNPTRLAAWQNHRAIQNSSDLSGEAKAIAHALRDVFDPHYYLSANKLALEDVHNPLLHYVREGRFRRFLANPLFDHEHYQAQSGVQVEDALVHYCRSGYAAAFSPHPLFDPRYYAERNGISGLSIGNPLFHYQTRGGLLRLDPSPLFDTTYYLSQVEHADEIEVPLERYVLDRNGSGPDPHPLFSAAWFCRDADCAPRAALVSYLKQRSLQFDRDPHPLFSVGHLLRTATVNADDRRSPLEQYLAEAVNKDVNPHPVFDSAYYRYQVECEREVELTTPPVVHYLTLGFRDKALRPHPLFDPAVYLKANGLEADGPELVRYLSRRDGEGLRCHDLFDNEFYDRQRVESGDHVCTTALEHWALHRELGLLTDSRLEKPLDELPLRLIERAAAIGEEFDVDFYRDLYREFQDYDAFAARDHYEKYGKGEGRHGSARSLLENVGIAISEVPIGFFPGEYVDLHPDLEVWRDQPGRCLLHYLEHGRAENRQIGLWQLKISGLQLDLPLRPSQIAESSSGSEPRLCILVHVYYPELWPELAAFTRNLRVVPSDVFINVTDTQWTPELQLKLRQLCPDAFVLISENRGRDIGGHFRLLEYVDIGRYESFAFMHTKKSGHLAVEKGAAWRRSLLAAFAADEKTATECVELFREQPKAGIIGAAAWRTHTMNGNQLEADRLMARLGIDSGNRRLDFVSGTMFMMRSEIVARLYREFRDTKWEDPSGRDASFFLDGQLEHAIERVIPSLARQMGYEMVWR